MTWPQLFARRSSLRAPVMAVVILVMIVAVARWPTTTAVGYNFEVRVKRLTLFEKTVAFVARDLELRRVAAEIGGREGTQEERVLRMYEWVVRNIHPTPPGLPVIDDHVLSIFIRHYGEGDQRAEALAALATYNGMPATALGLGKIPRHRPVQLTVVKVADRLAVFDVNNGIVFRKASGELAALQDLVADPSIVRTAGAGVTVEGLPYEAHFEPLDQITPTFVRMEKQQLWSRVKNEVLEYLTVR